MAKQNKKQKLRGLANKYIQEYVTCKGDFHYFCKKYIKIEMPGQDIPLEPYKKQGELINTIQKDKYVLVLKSRQIGISTIIQAYSAWLAVFYDNAVIGIISKDFKEATDFARAIRGMVEKLPDWMKPSKGTQGKGFAKRTEQSFILTNGSKVYASPVNPNAPDKTLRGKAITFLVIDEAAFISYIDQAWTSMVPALSTNQMHARRTKVPYGTVILSTPNKTVGQGKWYFENYARAITKDSIFKPFVIHWKMIPELADDPDWYKTQCQMFNNDPRKIAQELELKFLPAEGAFFTPEIMEKVQEACREPIEVLQLFNGEAWVFQRPIPGRNYIIGVDTAPEYGVDKSAITVWDYQTLEQVWEYQGKLKVLEFVKIVQIVARSYPGVVVVESNSYGNQVLEQVGITDLSTMLYKETRGPQTIVPGLSNNAKTRPLMIDALYSYINQFPESVRSKRLALELTGLVSKKSGKIEADTGCNDDLALATACCFYVRKYDPPVLIDTERFANATKDMAGVIGFNNQITGNQSNLNQLTNESIIKHARQKVIDEGGGFFDIMSMYSRE
jgi:hypothetical protein